MNALFGLFGSNDPVADPVAEEEEADAGWGGEVAEEKGEVVADTKDPFTICESRVLPQRGACHLLAWVESLTEDECPQRVELMRILAAWARGVEPDGAPEYDGVVPTMQYTWMSEAFHTGTYVIITQ
jgi:hypothetical protein